MQCLTWKLVDIAFHYGFKKLHKSFTLFIYGNYDGPRANFTLSILLNKFCVVLKLNVEIALRLAQI